MKVSLNWVKEFTDVKLPVDELVEKIGAQLGAVEEVIDYGKKYKGIVVAKVASCVKHPNADKLSLCKIDDGRSVKGVKRDKDGLVQVVCGAPNVKAGMLVVWLPPGVTVPASYDKDPLVLEVRDIRGQISNGMLASASELAFSDDHSGIAEMPFGEPGDDFAEMLEIDNDYVIDIENKMFTHRPDLFGILGVAREIAGITGKQFKTPGKFAENPEAPVTESDLTVSVKNPIPELVPRFTALVIEDVKVKPVSLWIQARLSQVGVRPINGVVDTTNFTMYLTAQPLHAYDYDKLCKVAGTKTPQLETRLSKKGDKLKLLNGKTLTFDDKETILITSNDVPVGVGGVMGGADTEVDENTKNVVLESANFDMYSIRRTSMRHGLFTDAVTRFNKGQSPLQSLAVLYLCAGWIQHQAMLHKASGKIGKATDVHGNLQKPIAVHVTAEFINARLGLELGIKEMAKLLTNVEFDVAINGPTLAVTPPFWRTDIEIGEDVVEEVGRLYGYDHLPLELPKRSLAPPPKDPLIELKKQIRSVLVAAGANEFLTYSFVHGNLLEKVGQDPKDAFQISNALSPDLQYYRLSLTPSLLEKVHPNIKAGHSEFAIFELGKTHIKGQKEDKLPKEFERLALVFAGDKKSAAKPAGAAYYQARMYMTSLLSALGHGDSATFTPINKKDTDSTATYFAAGRSATVKVDGKVIGRIGEYSPAVIKALKLPDHCAGFELDLEALLSIAKVSRYTPLPRFPKVEQDISLKTPAELSYGELFDFIHDAINKTKPRETTFSLEPLDIYQKETDKKHKQITLRLSIASYERTLVDQEVNKLLDDAAKKAHDVLNVERI